MESNKPPICTCSEHIKSDSKAKPFLKWAGGKTQLLSEIQKNYPFDSGKITKYAEPFVGGGAVLFDILNKYKIKEIYISDINGELVNAYIVIKEHVDKLIKALLCMQEEYVCLDQILRKQYYLSKRARYNQLICDSQAKNDIEKATLLIFLNKTCFNGLYRVNKKGEFNVPMGAYKNPTICDYKNLQIVSEKLKNVQIVCGDYKKSEKFIDENTFVYFDPPYRPINSTSNFTSYSQDEFGDLQQIELSKFVKRMNNRKAKILVSNSDPQNIDKNDDFFDSLYSGLNIKKIDATRMINCKSKNRGKIKELIICN